MTNAALSVEDVLDQLGVDVASVGEHEISAHCPFHVDSHPSFSMSTRSPNLWICYQCGERGSLEMLIQKISGQKYNPTEMLREIRYRASRRTKEAPEVPELPIDPLVLFARYESYRTPPDWALEERMIAPRIAKRYGLKWNKGWIIPIWSPEWVNGKIALWGWQFKRLQFVSNYPKAVKKSATLFGLRELRGSKVALVESPLDVARLASADVAAVASYGAFVSKAQIQLLIEVADRIVLALDSDEEGQRQMNKIYPYLARFVPTSRALFPAGRKDPGELDNQEVASVFK